MDDIETCETCGVIIDNTPIHVIDGDEYHVCSYNNNDADFGVAEFDQIPYGDKLKYGFSQIEF